MRNVVGCEVYIKVVNVNGCEVVGSEVVCSVFGEILVVLSVDNCPYDDWEGVNTELVKSWGVVCPVEDKNEVWTEVGVFSKVVSLGNSILRWF